MQTHNALIVARCYTVFQPFLEDLKSVIGVILNEIDERRLCRNDLIFLLEDWKRQIDNKSKLMADRANPIAEIDFLIRSIYSMRWDLASWNEIVQTIQEHVNSALDALETSLEALGSFKSKTIAPQSLLELCKAYILESNISSSQDIRYNSELFVENVSLEKIFHKFITKMKNKSPNEKRVFLILADLGMGKTWNAVHLAHHALDDHHVPVFFFSALHQFNAQLSKYFNTH